MDYDGRDEQTSFAIKIFEPNLPDFGSSEENLRNVVEVKNSNSNIKRFVVNQIMDENYHDSKEKSIPIKHFLIDFRSMSL